MMLLLKEDTFDKFLLYSALVKNYCTTQIDGVRETAENDSQTAESSETPKEEIASWKELRPVCYQLISGKTLPKYFRFVLLTDEKSTDYIRRKAGMQEDCISSFAMNIVFQNGELRLTTGVSYRGFTLDKSAEKIWDEMVLTFLSEKGIEVAE